MSTHVQLKVEGSVAFVEFSTPEGDVNVLTSENMTELRKILGEIRTRGEIKAVLFVSDQSKIFIAGANIHEIQNIQTVAEARQKAHAGKEVFQLIEDLPIPTVAVINGACVGGGFELALACRYRVASFSESVKIGLPEVQLGILPGFGGSIRLPRLLGLVKALPLLLSGKIVSAKDALKSGMVDQLFPEKLLRAGAVEFASLVIPAKAGIQELAGSRVSLRSPGMTQLTDIKITHIKKSKPGLVARFFEQTPLGHALVFRAAKQNILKQTHGAYPAPLRILELVRQTYGKNPAQSFLLESDAFAELAVTEISKNLITLFFTNERYKKMAWTQATPPPEKILRVGIIGAGVMGGGIAQLVSQKDIPVRIKDIRMEALGGALSEAERLYREAEKRRKIKPHEHDFKMGLISTGLTNDGLKDANFILEAVVENLEIKKKVLRELDAVTGPCTILASNTSSLSIQRMAEGTRYPERILGLHFFNPVHRMPLVEIIPTKDTSDETITRTVAFARTLGKTVIVVQDVAGFLVNRLLLPYLNEAAYLMEEGVSVLEIDRIAKKFGLPMGPAELVDQVGIDIGCEVVGVLEAAYGARMKASSLLPKIRALKLLGKKSGRGFYVYRGKKKTPNPEIHFECRGTKPSPEDTLKRMIYIMINEAARCLEEKVIQEPSTVDIGMIMGTGFPPFRGGLLRYADRVGIRNIHEDLKRFAQTVDPDRFTPSDYLARLAADHKTFYETRA